MPVQPINDGFHLFSSTAKVGGSLVAKQMITNLKTRMGMRMRMRMKIRIRMRIASTISLTFKSINSKMAM